MNLNSSRRSRDQTMHKTVDHVVPMKKEDRFDTIKRWQEENENEKAESATKIKDLEARNEVLHRELYEESRLVSSLENKVDGLGKERSRRKEQNSKLEEEKSKLEREKSKVRSQIQKQNSFDELSLETGLVVLILRRLMLNLFLNLREPESA